MIRQLVILVADDGRILIHGDDLPDLEDLEALVGEAPPEVEELISNCRLCG